MTWQVVSALLSVGLSACGIYLLFYAGSAVVSPRYFLRELWIDRRSEPHGWLTKVQVGALFVGGGLCGWFASQGLTLAIPADWGYLNEDGEWNSWRNYVAGIIAFVGACSALAIRPENPEVLIGNERIISEARDILLVLAKYHDVAEPIRERAELANKRASGSFRGNDYERRYWAHLLSEMDRQ